MGEWRLWSVMTFITLPQSGSIIDLDSVSFVIRIQNQAGGRGIRIGLGHSELQIITPDDARRFLEELRESKQVDVENLLRWDSADVDEHALARGRTATGDKSLAKIGRNVKTK